MTCADCGGPIGEDKGPPDGWQLDDGRTVCQACCVADLRTAAPTTQTTKLRWYGPTPSAEYLRAAIRKACLLVNKTESDRLNRGGHLPPHPNDCPILPPPRNP